MLALGVAACTGNGASDAANEASMQAGAAGRATHAERSLAVGTRVDATIQDKLSSRSNRAGESLRAVVSGHVRDLRGNVVIPAGSTVLLTVEQLEPGSDHTNPEGRLSLIVSSVTVNDWAYPLTASLDVVPHHLEGRGVTGAEAARIGAGTAIGAVAGQVIGRNTRSTVIGGAIGAVAGTAVAVRYAYRDVVVSAGTPIVFTLGQSLNVSAR